MVSTAPDVQSTESISGARSAPPAEENENTDE